MVIDTLSKFDFDVYITNVSFKSAKKSAAFNFRAAFAFRSNYNHFVEGPNEICITEADFNVFP